VWYRLNGREAMTRSTTVPIVLETIYGLAGITAPTAESADAYPGYPHVAYIRLLGPLFYVLWPVAVVLVWWTSRRSRTPRARRSRPHA
jgi:hypothetical protein